MNTHAVKLFSVCKSRAGTLMPKENATIPPKTCFCDKNYCCELLRKFQRMKWQSVLSYLSGAGELMDGVIFAMITEFITQMFALRRPFSGLFTNFHAEAAAK